MDEVNKQNSIFRMLEDAESGDPVAKQAFKTWFITSAWETFAERRSKPSFLLLLLFYQVLAQIRDQSTTGDALKGRSAIRSSLLDAIKGCEETGSPAMSGILADLDEIQSNVVIAERCIQNLQKEGEIHDERSGR